MLLIKRRRKRSLNAMSITVLALLLSLGVTTLAQETDPSDVDRPVPVERIHAMAGDRVELACQVVPGLISASHHDDDHRQQQQQHDQQHAPLAFESRSRSAPGGRHQQQATSPAYYSPPAFGGSARSRQQHASTLPQRRLRRYHSHRHYGDDYQPPADSFGGVSGGYSHELDEMDGGYLVLWFIDPERKPFYSLDMRRSRTGRHWWDEQRFGQRVRFFVPQSSGAKQPAARLVITNITRQDAGDYRCRVDYNNAPSRNFKYHIVVVEPPTSVVILDGSMHQLSIIAGPLEEGNDLILTCKAYGGHPQPWITWWQGGQLRDNTTDARSAEFVSNLLVVPRVGRRNLHDAFTCQVTSSPHLPPIMKTVTLELNLRPLFVEMAPSASSLATPSGHHQQQHTTAPKPLAAGQSVEFRCRTGGSRPAPTVTWWKGNKQILPNLSTTVHTEEGNSTESRLLLTPTSEDDASHLTCRVKNSMLAGAVLEDSIKLDVHYPPEVRIALGSNINGEDIKEGDDLYIECHIRSNPPFHKLQWTLNGVVLMHNVSAGVIQSNVSLVLRSVTHARAGLYACSAANSRGESTSQPPLRLRIKYAPRCRSASAAGTVSGVSKQETASLDCQVDADPATEVHFWWTFLGTPLKSNGTSLLASHGDAVLLPRSLFTSRGSTSVLQYLPKSELDFGVVACWASNAVGNQREPCLFHVVPAGKPAAPANCAIQNQTADSVRVDCQEAFDGGLQQVFGLELVDRDTRTVRYAFNNTKPVFTVYGLEPETAFLLNIYALNAKGRSQPITLETTTLKAAQKQTGHMVYFQMTPLLGVLIGVAATLLSIVAAVAVVVNRRNNRKRQRTRQENETGDPAMSTQTNGNTPNQQQGQQAHPIPNGNGNASMNGDANGQLRNASNKNLENGSLIQHYSKSRHPSEQHLQKDPDIILREMDLQVKHALPVAMVTNGSLHAKASTLRPGVGNKIDADGSDAESLLFRPELSSRTALHPRHLQQHHSSQSLSNRSSPSWNTSTPSSDRWSGAGHQSPSSGLFGAALTHQEQHKIAADLLANCRLPESSL